MNRTAIYAGSFDPPTYGHLDLVERAAKTFERLIVSVAESRNKRTLFTLEERMELMRQVVADYKNVEVDCFRGLLVDYAREQNVRVVIRGLRAFSDFEFEFQMALTNRSMAPDVETIFLMPKEEYSYVSSSSVREIASFGGDTGMFVPPPVAEALKRKVGPRTDQAG